MEGIKPFVRIAHSFAFNLGALRIFNEQIGILADEHDKNQLEGQMKAVKECLEIALGDRALLPLLGRLSLDQLESVLHEAQTKEHEEAADKLRAAFQSFRQDTERQASFLGKLLSFVWEPMPMQGELLRRGAITILISYFEGLLADIIKEFYKRYPEALPEEVQALKLRDIRHLKSLDEVKDYIISREIDSVLRKSLEDQLEYLSKRPKINLKPLERYKEQLIEIDQRRNLLVHNDSVVNRVYIERTPPELVQAYGITEGSRVPITQQYLSEAIDCVYVAGTILLQQSYRKWDKEDLEWADFHLHLAAYDSLLEGKYELTTKLADFAKELKFSGERYKRLMAVNHAIALKELDRLQEMQSVIGALDWSACSIEFKISFHVLKDETDRVFELMPKAIASEELKRKDLEEWPLFKRLRTTERFQEFVERHFSLKKSTPADLSPVSVDVTQ
jgi:hypothetical protein